MFKWDRVFLMNSSKVLINKYIKGLYLNIKSYIWLLKLHKNNERFILIGVTNLKRKTNGVSKQVILFVETMNVVCNILFFTILVSLGITFILSDCKPHDLQYMQCQCRHYCACYRGSRLSCHYASRRTRQTIKQLAESKQVCHFQNHSPTFTPSSCSQWLCDWPAWQRWESKKASQGLNLSL